MPATTSPAVEVTDLNVRRGPREVLHGLTCTVARGRVTGLLGPSGGGKSTLMRSIVGVQKTHGGQVRVLGEPAGAPSLRRRVGYVTQAPSVYADLTVGQNARYFARLVGADTAAADRAVADVGLASHRDALVANLSGGQRGRASLACALVGAPELLVLDEPTVGLDPVLRVELWDMFRALAQAGTTLIVSSHVMDEASRCDQLLLLREGDLIADDTPAAIAERTGTDDLEQAFLRLIEGQAGPRHMMEVS